jgi:hypothetical protein
VYVCVCVCMCVCVCVCGKSLLIASFTLVHLIIHTRIPRGERGAQTAFVTGKIEQTLSYVNH